MAMAMDNRQQPQLSGIGFEHMRYPAPPPHFTNPWASGPPPHQPLYSTSMAPSVSIGLEPRAASMAVPYHGIPITAPSLGHGGQASHPDGTYAAPNVLAVSQDMMPRSYAAYASSAPPHNHSYVPTSAPYAQVDYAYSQDPSRRSSHPAVPSTASYESIESQRQRQTSLVDFCRMTSQPPRTSFSDALDASRGMVSLSQSDITPRNIYGAQGTSRSSTDSYGFPTTHSAHSSISSASYGANGYYAGDGSATDYSSASESVDLASSRTLPRPSALLGASMPPAPQSMMGQFSSKVASSSQKKHKCKICDKRFTRPSSLQTHMYSHTGEKPFACEVEGCGRHFSVVSNLRRHRKVHKHQGVIDHPSPEDS